MRAAVGDRVTVPGRHVGDSVRSGQVLEVHGAEGAPPYVIRWDDGHEGICCPGPEMRIEHTAGI